MRRKFCIVFLCLLLTVGCEKQTELNQIGIVVAVAMDKDQQTGDIIFTSQVIRPGSLEKDGSSNEAVVEMLTTKGKTLFEAIRNTSQTFDRNNFYGHTKVIVINEELAKEGVTQFLDFLVRGKELRGYTWLCIAKNVSAREVIGIQEGIDSIQGIYLRNIIENKRYHNKATTASVIDYYRKVLKDGINPITGVLEAVEATNTPVEEKTSQKVKLSGTAVFRKDELVGYLNEQETQGLNWVLGDVESAAITLPSLLNKDKFVAIEVENLKSKINPEIEEKKISFNIKIEIDVTLAEEQSEAKLIYPKEVLDYLARVEEETARKIETDVELMMNKVQKEFESDILGFGSELNKKHPKRWLLVKGEWSEIFPQVNYKLEVKVNTIGVDLKQGLFKIEE